MTPRVLVEGLHFPECPRWHEGRLWFSDMHGHRVMRAELTGRSEVVAQLSSPPAGLGWTPEGQLLAVSMVDRRLLRLDGTQWTVVADLARLASFHCNDMVVDARGRACVGTFGFDFEGGAPFKLGEIILVDPSGAARVVADDARFPNGMVLTPDGRTLIVAESMGPAVRAYDVAADGSLSNGRTWAELSDVVPDGICLDAEGAIWVANAIATEVVRVLSGGTVTQRVAVSNHAFACMLGGPDRRTMFVLTADNSNPEYCRTGATGKIETFVVDVPGAGLP
ncbi:MAG TPA: SMP-30/gluconolactonase/LRE family protein [Candidatus Margulisiibacteriota bacterium]|nr:SMP-30/gluconolactonase/LRE family protein [Candidatus Margulisiibacteriota bacterium]